MLAPAIEVTNLQRTFGKGERMTYALNGINLAVEAGTIVGLLGMNGAGKTTLTKILGTLLLPSAGTARILGRDVVTDARSVRRDIGIVLGGDRGLYDRLTGMQNLEFFATLRDSATVKHAPLLPQDWTGSAYAALQGAL